MGSFRANKQSCDRGMKTIEQNETERRDRLFGFFSFII